MRAIYTVALAVWLICQCVGCARAQEVLGCGTLANAYGPFDYRDPVARRDRLPIVVEFHFTPKVEMLESGTSGTIIGDLNYTLRAFPNFPRALQALARYALEGGHVPEIAGIPTVDCYFERAIAFAPNDPAVRVIYGNYLFKRHEVAEARAQYEAALRIAPQSAEVNYDAALFFLDLGELDRAKKLGKIAYDGGYPLQGLRKMLAEAEAKTAAGGWASGKR